ncbi:MAG: hypothetical protein IT304_02850 [Dehalococcoidia bacterium]|nr:hypothetical protein [Dehalococcoidia bacterium]
MVNTTGIEDRYIYLPISLDRKIDEPFHHGPQQLTSPFTLPHRHGRPNVASSTALRRWTGTAVVLSIRAGRRATRGDEPAIRSPGVYRLHQPR